MRKVYGIEIIIALYFIAVSIYLFNAVDSPFWGSWYYLMYHVPIMFFLIELLRSGKYDWHLLLAAIVFNGLYAFFNISIANKDSIKYYELCTSKNLSLTFIVVIILLLLIVKFCKRDGR